MDADIIALITGIVNILLLIVVIVQTGLLKRQISDAKRESILANAPYIMPRFVEEDGEPILHLKNVGNGSAININIKVKSENGEVLCTIDRFAFLPGDVTHNTQVNLEQHPKVIIEGTYYDISERLRPINQIYTFPPSR